MIKALLVSVAALPDGGEMEKGIDDSKPTRLKKAAAFMILSLLLSCLILAGVIIWTERLDGQMTVTGSLFGLEYSYSRLWNALLGPILVGGLMFWTGKHQKLDIGEIETSDSIYAGFTAFLSFVLSRLFMDTGYPTLGIFLSCVAILVLVMVQALDQNWWKSSYFTAFWGLLGATIGGGIAASVLAGWPALLIAPWVARKVAER